MSDNIDTKEYEALRQRMIEAEQRAEQAEANASHWKHEYGAMRCSYNYAVEARDEARQEAARLREALLYARNNLPMNRGMPWNYRDQGVQDRIDEALQSAPPASEPECDACDDYGEVYIDDKRMACPNCADPARADRPEQSEAMKACDAMADYFCTHDVPEVMHVYLNRARKGLSQPAPAVPDAKAVQGVINEIQREIETLSNFGNIKKAWSDVPGASLPRDIYEAMLDSWREDLQSALAAQPSDSPAVPDGYALVPKEPTEKMLKAEAEAALHEYLTGAEYGDQEYGSIIAGYKAGIAAAPTPTDEGGQDE